MNRYVPTRIEGRAIYQTCVREPLGLLPFQPISRNCERPLTRNRFPQNWWR